MPPEGAGFVPSDEDTASVLAWFAEWDVLAAEAKIDQMADLAMFPVNTVTTNGAGEGFAEPWDREKFLAQMGEAVGGGGDVSMESVRTPHFISADLVFVITDAKITMGDQVVHARYGDLLVRSGGKWAFQTMVQGGWAA